jgi:hypothetical protein
MKSKAPVGGFVAGGIVCWLLSLYVFTTADPTHLLTTSRFSGAPIDPSRTASVLFMLGLAIFAVALWKRYLATL